MLGFITNKRLKGQSIKTISSRCMMRKNTEMAMKKNLLPGLAIGIPINILSYSYTNLHYGYDVTNIESTLLLFGLGYFAYNYDRSLDAINSLDDDMLVTKKVERNKYYLENIELYFSSLIVCYGFLTSYFSGNPLLLPFLGLINSTLGYKYLKSKLGEFKAIYIAACWCLACEILPCIIHDNSYEILNHPLDYIPLFLTLFGYSNLADIEDMDEDEMNGINTLPLKFGDKKIKKLALGCIFLSNILYGLNPHFGDNLLWNSLYEVGNFGYIAGEIGTDMVLSSNESQVNATELKNGNLDLVFIAIMARFLGI